MVKKNRSIERERIPPTHLLSRSVQKGKKKEQSKSIRAEEQDRPKRLKIWGDESQNWRGKKTASMSQHKRKALRKEQKLRICWKI